MYRETEGRGKGREIERELTRGQKNGNSSHSHLHKVLVQPLDSAVIVVASIFSIRNGLDERGLFLKKKKK